MKTKLFFLLVFFIANTMAQNLYEISWDSNGDVDYWEVYVETRVNKGNFTIRDGNNYKPALKKYFIRNVYYGATDSPKMKITIELPLSEKFVKVGIIANNGVRSKIGASKPLKMKKKINA